MLKSFIKYFLSLVILLHCAGVTQLVSAYSKDKSAFVGMLNMSEEETKKEKESKEEADHSKDIHSKISLTGLDISFIESRIYLADSKNRINHQFNIELPTPPPDSLVRNISCS